MSLWKRHRRRTAAVLVSVVLGAGLLPAAEAGADGVTDAQARMDRALDKIEQLDERTSILEEDLRDAEAELVDAQAAVEAARARIATLESQLSILQGELGELAVNTFISGDEASGASSLLTGAGTVTEIVEREEYARLAMSEGRSSTDELDAVLTDLETERQNLEAAERRAEQLIESVKNNQDATEKAEKAAKDAYAQAKQDYGEALVSRAAARQRQILADATAAQAAAAARLGNAGGGGGGGDGGDTGASASTGGSGSSGTPGAGRDVPPPSPGASGAVSAAQSQVGVAYRYASSSPGVAFDCSGLTAWAWEQAGVSLPHQSRAQYASTPRVSPDEAQPGDLIFFYNPISHVGLYVGGGMMVDAANHTLGVRLTAVRWNKVVGVGRPG